MKTLNEVRINLTSRSSNESFARVAVSSFFAQLDPTVDEVTDIKTAVSEAVTNAIVHGYKDKIGIVYITLRILDDATAYIKIRDTGCGIENVEQAMEPLFTTAPNDERAGLGFAVMQSFMDKVKVFSKKGRGTTVVLSKKIKSRQQNG
ncbi:MAG: anti-sigma F factor [Oscillospiraceae bacterium]